MQGRREASYREYGVDRGRGSAQSLQPSGRVMVAWGGTLYPALKADQAFSHSESPCGLSERSSWLLANWSGESTAVAIDLGISPRLTSAGPSMLFCGGV